MASGKRDRPAQAKQCYYSDVKTRTPITFHWINNSTEKPGTLIAKITMGGRERWLQIDDQDDARTLGRVPPDTALEIQSVGSMLTPALAMWRDGRRIDCWITEDRGGILHATGKRSVDAPPPSDPSESGQASAPASTGALPAVSIPVLREKYKEAFAAARSLAQEVGGDGAALDVNLCAASLFQGYVHLRAQGAPPKALRQRTGAEADTAPAGEARAASARPQRR